MVGIGLESWVNDLDFIFWILDVDWGVCGVFFVGIGCYVYGGCGDVLGVMVGEGVDYGCRFVYVGVVVVDSCDDLGFFFFGFGLGVVEGLEDLGEGVYVEIEEGVVSKIGVDYVVGVVEREFVVVGVVVKGEISCKMVFD